MNSWHSYSPQEVIEKTQSSIYGLSDIEAEKRYHKCGPNCLPHKPPPPWYLQLLSQFNCSPLYILGVAASIKLIMREFHDAAAIFFVIFFNALLGFFQERKADESLQALKKLSSTKAKVLRGSVKEIDSQNLVVGDIILLESGSKIPADSRLLESHLLYVDESMLTGESAPSQKKADCVFAEPTPLVERKNMIFSGTIVSRGRAQAVVVATGKNTEVASIAALTEKAEPPQSPLKKVLDDFSKKISIWTLSLMLILVLVGVAQGFSLSNLVMTCVSLAVSAIPESLPIAVTIALSYGLIQMAKKKSIIRHLSAVETLGCTTVICTDKTGTITQNEMTVDRIFIGQEYFDFSHPPSPSLERAINIAYYCSEAQKQQDGSFIGDSVDVALKKFAQNFSFLDTSFESDLILPFESELRMMACSLKENGKDITFWKGAFDALSPLCSLMCTHEGVDSFSKEELEPVVTSMAEEGYKVIALAYKQGRSLNPIQEKDLVLVGLLGLYDPPRRDAHSSVRAAKNAGIRVIMITGDHPKTAETIAKKVGIDSDYVLTGQNLDALSEKELSLLLKRTSIFAQTSPHHKWRIVNLLQEQKEVVAMTGDGVNDAPSLKQADIGISMGDGADVAQEASAMVLLNNNFSTIVDAIRQGRTIFKSLQQMATYVLTTCIGGVLTIAASIFIGIPLPLLPLQLLWINLLTDGTTTIPLVMEGEHGDSLAYPPRKKTDHFITKKMLLRAISSSCLMMIGTLGLFIWSYLFRSDSLIYARTIAFTTLSFFQIFNALNSRSVRRSLFFSYADKQGNILHKLRFFQNTYLLGTIVAGIFLQIIAVEWNVLQSVLETMPLSFQDWGLLLAISFSVIVFVEITKFFTRE